MFKNVSRRAAIVAFLMLGLSTPIFAASPPSMGLGQTWPNTADVSPSPHWHAYVFMLGGIKYVQINDINGNVLGAVGTVNGQFIILPIGRFSQLVATPQEPVNARKVTTATPVTSPTTVYQDGDTLITATMLSNGAVQLTAAACDPIECNSHGLSTGTTTGTSTTTCDPVECNSHRQVTGTGTITATCDPVECNSHGLSTGTTTGTSTTTCDPIECNSHRQ